jgi:hypothetical protein
MNIQQEALIDVESIDTTSSTTSSLAFKPSQINDLIEDILNRYSKDRSVTTNASLSSSIIPTADSIQYQTKSITNISTSTSNIPLVNTSVSSNSSSVDRLANYLMLDFSQSNDKHIQKKQQSFIHQKQQNVTIPQEFKFQLDQRKLERRHPDVTLQVEQERMAECTFRPSINPHNSVPELIPDGSYKGEDFFDRVMNWKKQKQLEKEQLGSRIEEHKLDGCTFHPNVNPTITEDNSYDRHHKLYIVCVNYVCDNIDLLIYFLVLEFICQTK